MILAACTIVFLAGIGTIAALAHPRWRMRKTRRQIRKLPEARARERAR